jgi:hypothetical protein
MSARTNGVLKSDIFICNSTDQEANSRNYATIMTAYTLGWQVRIWFGNYSACTDVPAQYASGSARIWPMKPE